MSTMVLLLMMMMVEAVVVLVAANALALIAGHAAFGCHNYGLRI